MYYHDLYEKYVKEADTIKNYIKFLKKDFANQKDLDQRIPILYSMYLDLKHTAEYLKFKCGGNKNEK